MQIKIDGQAVFAEFAPDSRTIYFEAMHGVGARAIWRVDRDGGEPELIHRYTSPQWFSGISLSPDATSVVYIAPAPDGRLQLFRVTVAGREPTQITFDPSDNVGATRNEGIAGQIYPKRDLRTIED